MFVAYIEYSRIAFLAQLIAIWGHVSFSSTDWLNYAVPDYEISIVLSCSCRQSPNHWTIQHKTQEWLLKNLLVIQNVTTTQAHIFVIKIPTARC